MKVDDSLDAKPRPLSQAAATPAVQHDWKAWSSRTGGFFQCFVYILKMLYIHIHERFAELCFNNDLFQELQSVPCVVVKYGSKVRVVASDVSSFVITNVWNVQLQG